MSARSTATHFKSPNAIDNNINILLVVIGGLTTYIMLRLYKASSTSSGAQSEEQIDYSVLPCIRDRRSVFPKQFLKNPPPLKQEIIQSLLDAALWSPFHGRCYAGNQHPAKFVVLGRKAMVAMQNLTLDYYDRHWREVGWASMQTTKEKASTLREEDYNAWREMTHEEITGRWGPCACMIAIVMRRQSGPKRLPRWEEAAAVATAVQNMHIQSTKFPQLACYWSSWHEAARNSDDMKEFLGTESKEDECMGFFIVAQHEGSGFKDRRKRDRSLIDVEWRQ